MKLTLAILLFALLPCGRPALKVLDAVSMQHVPGRKESPVVTQYDITVVTGRGSDILALDEIYIKQVPCGVKILDPVSGKPEERFQKGDTLLLRATRYEKSGEKLPDIPAGLLPEKYAGSEVVIAYRIRGRKGYLPVEKVRIMPGRVDL